MKHSLLRYGSPLVVRALLLALLFPSAALHAEDGPLSGRPTASNTAIVAGSVGLRALVTILPERPSDSASYSGYEGSVVDRWWRAALHGGRRRKTNFLDHSAGSLLTPAAGALVIAALDINRREFSRDMPLFMAGAVSTGAFTDAVKRLMSRPRPYCQNRALMPSVRSAADPYHTESFFSGHSSQAFFTAGFVNNRLRRHMRQEWNREEYRSWRWASPVVCYGWAAFVGLSRVQSDKHHFTDVCVGALAGYAVGELFYRLCYTSSANDGAAGEPATFLEWRFTF